MDKSDFKVIYNLTKSFDLSEFKNILKNTENETLTPIIEKIGVEEVRNVINKIKNFSLVGGEEEVNDSSEQINSVTSTVVDLDDVENLSVTSINTEIREDFDEIMEVDNKIEELDALENEVDAMSNLLKEPEILTINNQLKESEVDSEVMSIGEVIDNIAGEEELGNINNVDLSQLNLKNFV